MSSDQLAANLRLLTSYGRSVADVCRKAGFNRQQFTKYLSGGARPSLASLRRICDFFGVEEHEILRDPESFRALIRLRPPRLKTAGNDPVTQFFTTLAGRHDPEAAAKLAGYYFLHMQDEPRAATITRSLLRMTPETRCLSIKVIERFSPNVPGLPRVLKYAGFAVVSDGRVYVAVDEILARRSLWFGIHYASDFSGVSFLNGIGIGDGDPSPVPARHRDGKRAFGPAAACAGPVHAAETAPAVTSMPSRNSRRVILRSMPSARSAPDTSGLRRSERFLDHLGLAGEQRLVGHLAGMGAQGFADAAGDDMDMQVIDRLAGGRLVELLD